MKQYIAIHTINLDAHTITITQYTHDKTPLLLLLLLLQLLLLLLMLSSSSSSLFLLLLHKYNTPANIRSG
jgi:hypothetical protein